MTTVVCTRTQMASDSRASGGDATTTIPKIFRIRGGLLGIAGTVADCMAFVSWFRRGCDPENVPDMSEVSALYLDKNGKIVHFDHSPYSYEIKADFAVLGSGGMAAAAALHMGADLRLAIRTAAKVDTGTGGRIHVKDL